MNTATSLRYSIQYADFWQDNGGGLVKGLFTTGIEAAADGVIALDELTAWDLAWTGNDAVAEFSISSNGGSVIALTPPGGFLIEGENRAIAPDFSDADGLDQGLYEAASGERIIDLGAALIEDFSAGTFSQGNSETGSVLVSKVLDFGVKYSGFWDGDAVIKGGFSISEADAADGIASLDELVAWSWNWSGNEEIAAFSVSSQDGEAFALLPPGGFLLEGINTPIDASFADPDGLDQGLYVPSSGEQSLDLGALIIEDFIAGSFLQGNAGATGASISVSPLVVFDVSYLGFWGNGDAVTGAFSISEADAADGVASLDELVDWSWSWSGNSDVSPFTISSDDGSVTALLPPSGFLLTGRNTAFNSEFVDGDGLDQGLYQSGSGEQSIDLGALIIEDFAAGTLAQGDADAASGIISVRLRSDGDRNAPQQVFGTAESELLMGKDGDDQLYGNGGFDVFYGGGGNDQLFGGQNRDVMFGDGGDDLLYGNGGGDELDGGAGNDKLYGSGDSDSLSGGDGDDILYGNGGTDLLVGGAGNDLIYGGAQADRILGGAGDDKIYANGGADVIDSGSGMDEVWLGGAGNATVILSIGEGYDFIANYQMGSTTLKGFAESELTLRNGAQGAEIFKGDDKLAVVGWKTVSELSGAFVV
ncbi:MAG: calcium-binding protein [Synechococcales cyanobacterium RM1_1_8]|nr:calcium-binding protein [Synechococcales cyanobacterium RM1_1_8]